MDCKNRLRFFLPKKIPNLPVLMRIKDLLSHSIWHYFYFLDNYEVKNFLKHSIYYFTSIFTFTHEHNNLIYFRYFSSQFDSLLDSNCLMKRRCSFLYNLKKLYKFLAFGVLLSQTKEIVFYFWGYFLPLTFMKGIGY